MTVWFVPNLRFKEIEDGGAGHPNNIKITIADGHHLEKSKNVVLMDIINNCLLKTGNKTANINVKKTAVYTHC